MAIPDRNNSEKKMQIKKETSKVTRATHVENHTPGYWCVVCWVDSGGGGSMQKIFMVLLCVIILDIGYTQLTFIPSSELILMLVYRNTYQQEKT